VNLGSVISEGRDMRIGELAQRAAVTAKAVRYYESIGLLDSRRLANGYRDYDEDDVRLVREVRNLAGLGITAEKARPFLDCLSSGRDSGDDCPASLETYRSAIDELDDRIRELSDRREALLALLDEAQLRTEPLCELASNLISH
jgi:DNA-binding transcriptional MerR regulator